MSYGELLRTALDQGLPLGKALATLRGDGASPLEAAAAVQAVTGRPLEDARAIVRESRAWTGPRSGDPQPGKPREWHGAIGQHGRSGHGALSVLPHLWRPAPRSQGHASS